MAVDTDLTPEELYVNARDVLRAALIDQDRLQLRPSPGSKERLAELEANIERLRPIVEQRRDDLVIKPEDDDADQA
jgi:hypothetical protein